jgi:putative tRNA adenosine deaminase-associated protein
VSYFAAAVARGADGWSASTVSLTEAADVEDVADQLRDLDPEADVALLFAEFDDAYLVILRLDLGEDLRVFGSDTAFATESRFGALLLGELGEPAEASIEVAETEAMLAEADSAESESDSGTDTDSGDDLGPPVATLPDSEPIGDPDLLSDLGVPARKLLELCAQEGMLPGDITAELCQAIGCGDEVEELREA